jgi:hypothetical protein
VLNGWSWLHFVSDQESASDKREFAFDVERRVTMTLKMMIMCLKYQSCVLYSNFGADGRCKLEKAGPIRRSIARRRGVRPKTLRPAGHVRFRRNVSLHRLLLCSAASDPLDIYEIFSVHSDFSPDNTQGIPPC